LPLLLELLAWKRRKATPKEVVPAPAQGEMEEETEQAPERAVQISEAAEALLAPGGPIDTAALAQYWGVASVDADASAADKEAKKEMEAKRKALRIALFAKANALAPPKLAVAESAPATDATPSPFVAAVREMRKWVTKPEDLDEAERDAYASTLAKYELAHCRSAAALAVLQARHKAKPSRALASDCIEMYSLLDWEHWASQATERMERDYPRAKRPL